MKFTWHWLLDHLKTDKTVNDIVEALPKLGLEVASVKNLSDDLREFISAEVLMEHRIWHRRCPLRPILCTSQLQHVLGDHTPYRV